MREIVFDTETTGLEPLNGDRLVEIGCIELVNRFPTGKTFHRYVNPERDMPAAAFAVHGLSAEFLSKHARFAEVVEDFMAFIGDAPLIAHNASFDLGFINAELERASRPAVGRDRLIDTLLLARRRFPGGQNNLDNLCSRFGIDNSHRTKHGALLDAELLAEVYLELIGARQTTLGLSQSEAFDGVTTPAIYPPRPQPLADRTSEAERTAHLAFVATLGASAIWRDYIEPPGDDVTASAKS
jgi:DNA polymerase-3 subunit epsilon